MPWRTGAVPRNRGQCTATGVSLWDLEQTLPLNAVLRADSKLCENTFVEETAPLSAVFEGNVLSDWANSVT